MQQRDLLHPADHPLVQDEVLVDEVGEGTREAAISTACRAEKAWAGLVSMPPAMKRPMLLQASSSSDCSDAASGGRRWCPVRGPSDAPMAPRRRSRAARSSRMAVSRSISAAVVLAHGEGWHRCSGVRSPSGAEVDGLALAVAGVHFQAQLVEQFPSGRSGPARPTGRRSPAWRRRWCRSRCGRPHGRALPVRPRSDRPSCSAGSGQARGAGADDCNVSLESRHLRAPSC